MSSALVRRLSDSFVGDRIKASLGFRVPDTLRPRSRRATLSDLFLWRVDAEWETRFHVMNLPSLAAPHAAAPDHSELIAFDIEGREVARRSIVLPPFATATVDLGTMARSGHGTFACFHDSPAIDTLRDAGAFLADRSYVAFRRRGDRLWSYAHGNAHALAKAPANDQPAPVTPATPARHVYRPQLRFDDCAAFELFYANAVGRALDLTVRLLDAKRRTVSERLSRIAPGGLGVVRVDNRDRNVAFAEGEGRQRAWRPLIFKLYESHFDVLHG